MKQAITLYELNTLVREVVEEQLPMSYWVIAELSECRESHGHCYMELVQKDDAAHTPVARASAKCWRSKWQLVRPRFERVTGQTIRAGQQIMLLVHAQFHETYGFSWIVDDINPEYTLGDMARRRMEIIAQLKSEGIFELNKELELPHLANRVAVISSQTAAGYGDFCDQLNDNTYNLNFSVTLFPAIMQGEQIEESIISALDEIASRESEFDVVVIIRGGGATADLSGFDTLALAENVAQFPLPVITGIGHDRDECILDMIAFASVKTPTAAATFLIEHLYEVLTYVDNMQIRIVQSANGQLSSLKERIRQIASQLPIRLTRSLTKYELRIHQLQSEVGAASEAVLTNYKHHIERLETLLPQRASQVLDRQRHSLELLSMRVKAVDPQRILDCGYSITTIDGKAVKDTSKMEVGMTVKTRVAKGEFVSEIKHIGQ